MEELTESVFTTSNPVHFGFGFASPNPPLGILIFPIGCRAGQTPERILFE